jgi:Arylsulfatase A and related enzymes
MCEHPNNRPNLVMVMTDEHNLRTLSCYRDYLLTKFEKEKVDVWGDVSLDTPNIDSLAAGGALYTNFYSVDPSCTPSRASFMSGMYPPFTGAKRNRLAMDQDVVTWAEMLRDNGYATSYIGKFHLDGTDKPGWGAPDGREFGFDDDRFRFNRGHWKYFEIVDDTLVKEYENKDRNRFAGRYETAYATDFLMDRGIEFIEDSAAAGNPFAVVISIPDPHGKIFISC